MEPWPETADALQEAYGTFVTRYGEWKATVEMSAAYGIGVVTVRKRLRLAGLRTPGSRRRAGKPLPEELCEVYEGFVAEHGRRWAIGKLAERYGVVYMTARQWLLDAELHVITPQTAHRPIPEGCACTCGAPATTRYKDQDPPLCFRCYMRAWSADPQSPVHRLGREYVAEVKKAAVCADCGEKYPPCVFHFDHVPGRGPKLFNVGNGDYAIETVKAEIAKCDIVCANCHAIRTWITRGKSLDEAV